ncbi:MAG: sulfotransferase [Pseudomonadales bacterium]
MLGRAAQRAQGVLAEDRNVSGAHFLTALIALQSGRRAAALESFANVVQLDPLQCTAWAHMAEIYVGTGDLDNAQVALAKAIQNDDGSVNVQQLIAMTLASMGDNKEAAGWFERAVAQQPDNVHLLTNYANCLIYLGRFKEAEVTLLEALRIQPAYPNPHWLLSGLNKAKDRIHIKQMMSLLALDRYAPQDRAFMNYACGKELEDIEAWGDAFEAFSQGAQNKRKSIIYDESAEIEMYSMLEELYSKAWLLAGEAGYDDASPIFVIGQPRSGTTLVEHVIAAHSLVGSAGELRHFSNGIRKLTDCRGHSGFTAELVSRAVDIDFKSLGEQYITAVGHRNEQHFVDKLPSNFLFVPLILKALPNARIIHVRRDPMDACFASFKQLFADAYPHSYDQAETARHHARYYRLMSVWRERFGDRYHELRYEDLVTNLQTEARALISFLALPWEDGCLQPHQQKTSVATASAVQVREPMHTKSIGR